VEKRFPFGRGNVTTLALSMFFSAFYLYVPVSTLYLQGKGLNFVEINSLWGIIVATKFAMEVPAGVIGDRIGRKVSINIALALQLLGEIVYIFARSYPGFVLAAVIGGAGFAFASGCVEALIYDSLRARKRETEMTRAMGVIDSTQRFANLLAFAAGGLLLNRLTQARFVLAIVLTACSVAVGILISLTLKEPSVNGSLPEAGDSLTLVSDGLSLFWRNRTFRRLTLLALATVPFRDYLLNLYPPTFVAAEVPARWLSLAPALASGLSIAGARYAYVLEARFGRRTGLLVAATLPGLLHLAFGGIARLGLEGDLQPWLPVAALCLLSGSMSLKGPIMTNQLNRQIADHNRATMLSLISMASGLYVALMGLLVGRIGDLWLPGAFLLMGTVVLTGAVIFRIRS
jgi:MFS family permease